MDQIAGKSIRRLGGRPLYLSIFTVDLAYLIFCVPRQARIDASGAVHHIISRGIERERILRNDQDSDAFISRLGQKVVETRTMCSPEP